MDNFPFELEPTEYELMRVPGKDGKTIFTVEHQLFNTTIKRYTGSYSWNTQW